MRNKAKNKIAIHQPNFLPWLGYFKKIREADIFVIYDDIEYTKNSFINRNKIKTGQGIQWLTIPVKYSGNSSKVINKIEIAVDERGIKKILKTIKFNYSKSISFKKYYDEFESILLESSKSRLLCDINIALVSWINGILDINTKLVLSSELGIDLNLEATERLIAICKTLEANSYISGKGGFNYQDISLFESENINVLPNKYSPVIYNQLWSDFIPNLSVIDFIFNLEDNTSIF